MNLRAPLLGVACGVTTLLVVGALTITALSGPFGDSPGVGILGLFAGLFAGLTAAVVVGVGADRLAGWRLSALVAYGAFGTAFLLVAGLQYVNVPGADDLFTFPVHLATSALLAAAVTLLDARRRRSGGVTPA